MFDNFLAKLAGKYAAKKLDLKEGNVDNQLTDAKPWYTSKTVWSDVTTVAISIVGLVDLHFTHGKIASSPIYSIALSLLGGMGIISRVNATQKIG